MIASLWCLLVRGEVLGEAGEATCAEHGESFVGGGDTLGDVATAVVAPVSPSRDHRRNSGDSEQVFHGAPIARCVRHNLHLTEQQKRKDSLALRAPNNARVVDRHLRGWLGQLAVGVVLAWVSASKHFKGVKEKVEAAQGVDLGRHDEGRWCGGVAWWSGGLQGGSGVVRWWRWWGVLVVVVRSVCFTRVSVHSRARVQRITGQSPRESNSQATAPAPTSPDGRYHKDMRDK